MNLETTEEAVREYAKTRGVGLQTAKHEIERDKISSALWALNIKGEISDDLRDILEWIVERT